MKTIKLTLLATLTFLFFSSFAIAQDVKTDGENFLKGKTLEKGVITLPSGLMYKVITEGTGKTPTIAQKTKMHYHGTSIDGKVFDSSIDRGTPLSFAPNQVIKGWTEAMQLMKEGSVWEVYLPYQLAYGARGAGGSIKPYQALVFRMEMIKVL
ncbi:MAG: FKBP-type peptidyl-prolyl cis-trans isomerase FklB [Urechidicola sp.]|jgi:FKBP-type peptidyl-prolyl cis-trans isomerase FklB|tara:strand:+ start:2598 stop:3056 length:459 start_codon:yes stop_codon:yes gene_type:complete